MNTEWTPPPAPIPAHRAQPPRRKRGLIVAAGLLGAGAVAGGAIGTTVLSNAATTSSSSSSTTSTGAATDPRGGGNSVDLSGTVTAVGSSTVTIKTTSGTTVYKVNANSDIDKNGESSLSKLAVGDAVTFSVDSSAKTTIDKLHAGTESLNEPRGGGHGLDLSGTVTAVGSSTVTIKTTSGTTVYKVDANSDIDKNGESSLSKLAVGDAVTFSVDSSAKTTIDKLHAGTESLNKPTGR